MIGDSTYDVQMACAAGVRALGVAWGYHAPDALLAAGAHAILEDFASIDRTSRAAEPDRS